MNKRSNINSNKFSTFDLDVDTPGTFDLDTPGTFDLDTPGTFDLDTPDALDLDTPGTFLGDSEIQNLLQNSENSNFGKITRFGGIRRFFRRQIKKIPKKQVVKVGTILALVAASFFTKIPFATAATAVVSGVKKKTPEIRYYVVGPLISSLQPYNLYSKLESRGRTFRQVCLKQILDKKILISNQDIKNIPIKNIPIKNIPIKNILFPSREKFAGEVPKFSRSFAETMISQRLVNQLFAHVNVDIRIKVFVQLSSQIFLIKLLRFLVSNQVLKFYGPLIHKKKGSTKGKGGPGGGGNPSGDDNPRDRLLYLLRKFRREGLSPEEMAELEKLYFIVTGKPLTSADLLKITKSVGSIYAFVAARYIRALVFAGFCLSLVLGVFYISFVQPFLKWRHIKNLLKLERDLEIWALRRAVAAENARHSVHNIIQDLNKSK